MTLEHKKLEIISWTAKETDVEAINHVLNLIHNINEDLKNESKIVGYLSNGMSVSMSEFIATASAAESQAASGEKISLEELETISETW